MNLDQILLHLSQDRLLIFALPVFLIAIVIEYKIGERRRTGYYLGVDFRASLAMGVLSLLVEFIPKIVAFGLFYWLHEANFLGLRDIVGRQWWAWCVLLLADDFSYYWFHRLNHEVRIFWAGHVPHHSSRYLNLGTALRQGVGERVHKYLFWVWLPIFGFDPVMIFSMISINLIYQFWIHTELIEKLPRWFEAVFNTPSHHRVHHASQPRYLDCNHAGTFIVWDRLFGTFTEEQDFEKPDYGLTKDIDTHRWCDVATHEYAALWKDVRRARKLSDKLKYILYAPGWSHDGPDLRARVLRQQVA